MKVVLREDESGVSEVIGTFLILAMTVVLFSTIIVWVSSIPGPVAQTRLDIQGTLTPKFGTGAQLGLEVGDYVNLTHNGGEALQPGTTVIYIVDQKGSANSTTSTLRLHLLQSGATPNGLLDGADSVWNVGERWTYFNALFSVSDKITVTIVDTSRSTVVWTSTLTPPAGTRPPIFLNVWANRYLGVATISTPVTGAPVYIFGQVTDLDGDLNSNSVYAILAILYGTSNPCVGPQKMYDDGTNGDQTPFDGIFTLARTSCLNPDISWDGSLVLFNATDLKGHQSTTRMTLHVVPGPTGGTPGGGGNAGSGRPPNLRWNGNQGYNIFNATQWDQFGYQAQETRTFTGSDTVVIVVGSLTLENTFGIDTFNLWDPYSGNPSQAVVYGATKTVSLASAPSSQQSFTFFQFVNGYYVYTYRFKLNDAATVGTNFYTTPPQYPRYYYFAKYPLSMLLASSTNNKFSTTDSINITSTTGQLRSFPVLQTFSDRNFNNPSSSFRSTDTVYVKVQMLTADLNSSLNNVIFGNVVIQDFSGGQELSRAPLAPTGTQNGPQANLPLCPIWTPCSGQLLQSIGAPTSVYRFSIDLARVNQDPWVAGAQHYALSISTIKDSDETYGMVSAQIVVTAPLYKMDAIVGAAEATQNAWGTKNYAFFFQNYNGFDAWKPQRVDYCSGGISTSGVAGSGATCPTASNVVVAYLDYNQDGTLDMAEQFTSGNDAMFVIYRRTFDASGSIIYLPVFFDNTGGTQATSNPCTALATGDVTGDGAPEVVCGASNGWVWYYKNDGSWTRVYVDQSRTQMVKSVSIGDFNGDGRNDIAVGGASGRLTWYPNLDGLGRFQNTGINDNWFPVAEQTATGSITGGGYLSTYVADSVYEQLTEGTISVSQQNGGTVNPGFDAGNSSWTFATITGTSSGTWQPANGNLGGFAQVQTNFQATTVVSGYWYQSFTVTSFPLSAASLDLNWKLINLNGASSAAFYAWVDATSGKPPANPSGSGYVWTSGAQTVNTIWMLPASVDVSSKITAPGTYYLKIAMYTTYGSSGGAATGGFDNVALSWTSVPGQTSALEQYWRINTLPNRPGTAYTFNLRARMSPVPSPDLDTFGFHYSTNVVGTDPTTGTYTLLVNVTSATDVSSAVPLPSSLGGATVWIKALDTNRFVGSTNADIL
ncbi:MAG: FG-GAP-like repeat-containing protein, partial [Candidatus Thermoplasmatota archaeon]